MYINPKYTWFREKTWYKYFFSRPRAASSFEIECRSRRKNLGKKITNEKKLGAIQTYLVLTSWVVCRTFLNRAATLAWPFRVKYVFFEYDFPLKTNFGTQDTISRMEIIFSRKATSRFSKVLVSSGSDSYSLRCGILLLWPLCLFGLYSQTDVSRSN